MLLVGLRGEQLGHRPLHPEHGSLRRQGGRVVGEAAAHLHVDHGPHQLVAHCIVVDGAAAVSPAGAAGPVDSRLDHRRRRELAAGDAPLVLEGGLHHRPAVVHFAEPPLVAQHHVVVEGGVGPLVSHRLHGLDLDPGRVEGHHEECQPSMLGHLGVGPGEQQHVVGHMGQSRPHLGAVDDPPVSVAHGPGAGRSDVRAGLGLAVAQACQSLTGHQPGGHRAAQMIAAVLQDHRHRYHGHPQSVRGRLVELQLLEQNAQLDRVHPASPELGRHRARQPAPIGDGPVQGGGVDGAVAGRGDHLAGEVLGQELPNLCPEIFGPCRHGEVHYADLFLVWTGESRSRRIGVTPALVRCAHGPLGPRPR